MAEVVGLVASILGTAGTATSFSLGFDDLISKLGKAGQITQAISSNLTILSVALNELADACGRPVKWPRELQKFKFPASSPPARMPQPRHQNHNTMREIR
jgi:hypothetical protein